MSELSDSYFNNLKLPKGKSVLITGGNSGVGLAYCEYMVRLDWHIYFAIRNLKKGEEAKKKLLEINPNAKIDILYLDLSKPDSIKSFCKKVMDEHIDIDVFYCNAGIYRTPFEQNLDGFESQAFVNAIANYWMYHLLKDHFHSLPHKVKFILTTSIVARWRKFKEIDLTGGKKYKKARAYARSKVLVNMIYTRLVKDEQGTNLLPLLVHPGITYTPLIDKAYPNKRFQKAAQRFLRAFCHAPDKAALSAVYLMQDKIDRSQLCGPRGIGHISGFPVIYPLDTSNLKNGLKIVEILDKHIATW